LGGLGGLGGSMRSICSMGSKGWGFSSADVGVITKHQKVGKKFKSLRWFKGLMV